MNIKIHDELKISALQTKFNQVFPYLKIEIFSKLHKVNQGSPKSLMVLTNKTLAECRSIHKDGKINITPKMTVADLEKEFADVYGLSVQVFRKSGKLWLETTVTDSWTLEKQNLEGEELSKKSGE